MLFRMFLTVFIAVVFTIIALLYWGYKSIAFLLWNVREFDNVEYDFYPSEILDAINEVRLHGIKAGK